MCGPDGAVVARAGLGTEEILYAGVSLASTVHLTPVYCSSGIDDRDCMASG